MAYQMAFPLAIEADRSERAAFVRRTYAHLACAILAFIGLETAIFAGLRPFVGAPAFDNALRSALSSQFSWLIVMVAFIGVSYLANYWAFNGGSPALQYAGLALYVVAEAIIFIPLLYVAMFLIPPTGGVPGTANLDLVGQAGILTLCLFAGLTAAVFMTGKDFSFLGPIIGMASFIAFGVIICAMLFGFGLDLWFSLAMIVLAAGSILYNTSNVLHRFRLDQHVAASLSLFASVALLFYYVLLALMQSRR
jgi:FtsH-binding integral membrane protein